jgi:hypothetical protein
MAGFPGAWHLGCVLRALERVTRAGEDRGPVYHYEWNWH